MRAWAGELVGTYAFVTIASGSVVVATGAIADIGVLGVALAQGAGLAAVITVFASTSGAHLNPAVTLSALVGRKIRSVDALGYMSSQVLGALGAGITLRIMFEEASWRPSSIGTPALSVSTGKGVLIEAVLTFLFVLVIWGAGIAQREGRPNGFAIGFALVSLFLAAGPLTGPALNPARYLGPAAVADDLGNWWVYVVGPGIGGLLGGILYPTLFGDGFPWSLPRRAPASPPARRKPARATRARKR
jgi:aquaporin Z